MKICFSPCSFRVCLWVASRQRIQVISLKQGNNSSASLSPAGHHTQSRFTWASWLSITEQLAPCAIAQGRTSPKSSIPTGNKLPTLKILLPSSYVDKMHNICLVLSLYLSYNLTDGITHQIISENCFFLCSMHITSANMSDSQLLNFPK